MREQTIQSPNFPFINILSIHGYKKVGEHAKWEVCGHIAKADEDRIAAYSAGKKLQFYAVDSSGQKKTVFSGVLKDLSIEMNNEVCILQVKCVSNSIFTDMTPHTRTFQDASMKFAKVFKTLENEGGNATYLLTEHDSDRIDRFLVQYKETDWQFAKRVASRLNTVLIPDCTTDSAFIAVGLPQRSAKEEPNLISSSIRKDSVTYLEHTRNGQGFSEMDALSYEIKTRDIYDLGDQIPYRGFTTYVYAVKTTYEGNEMVHCYELRKKGGFFAREFHNEKLIGASLCGKVKGVKEDLVQVEIEEDVRQSKYKWFSYSTHFSSPDGPGWYFMPESGDEIRLRFPCEKEEQAYVSSAVHITHDERSDPKIKFIRTIHGQEIRFTPSMLKITDGKGSSIVLDHKKGITLNTNKSINLTAQEDITVNATGKITISGDENVRLKNNASIIRVDENIDIVSEHTRVQ